MIVRVRTALALLALAHVSCALVDDVLDIIKIGKEISEDIINSWDIVGKPFNATGGVELPLFRRREKAVLARIAQITRAINKVEASIERTSSMLVLLSKNSGKGTRLELRLHEMADLLSRVSAADAKMREYVTLQRDLEKITLENFAMWCVSHDSGALPSVLDRVHALVAPPHKHLLGRDLFGLVLEDVGEEHPDLCELQMSQHQLIFDMYNTISLAEIKGYAMMQFSWMLLRIYGKGNFTQEASLTRQRYGQRTNQTAAAARAALSLAKRDLHRCDPAAHKEGVTYDMVKRLLQGYIENEVDMNSDGTCRENCAYYTVAENKNCYQDLFCKKQTRCGGRIIDCTFLESDMWVCQPNYRHDHRRYEWIKYESGRTLGHPDTCSGSVTKVESWWRWLFWHCSYCMCLCDDPNSSETDRYFSLREATSEAEHNKVVTGLRLVKYGRVFHLQISQGTLGERGLVTPGSWVEPENKFDPKDYEVNEGVDFHTLTYEKRAIDLDELDSPSGHVMTGARFRMIGAHLHFEIRSTPFNYTTGALSHQKSVWISNDNTDGTFTPRKKLELSAPDIPTRSGMSLPVDSQHDQYMEFTHTDMNKDAAQNTVPFIDIQPVEPLKGAALLSGAGIIHRGASGSGGFLAAKVITYDFSKHVQAELPSEENYHEDDTTDFVPVVN
ncbi:uncharacterized protein LOC106138026 isoform X2 [Amyelois transitella]|uniref:uncharacterized protein LOC106138026 isoform X2 n=1 Tax=Amyelois transitella TaxID=680683 RepID=UPI00298FCA12|nr:uncharacterized protein LOC106138026 isoform X2 [Amyelois transitella]